VAGVAAELGYEGVFTVRLPLAGKDSRTLPPREQAPARAQPGGLQLLVVDDNRDAAETLAALLGILGHNAPVAADGHQALRMIAGLRPSIVFLDIGMPATVAAIEDVLARLTS
jgi:PleD family two-component response regulator